MNPKPLDTTHYRTFGFLLIRGAFDPRPLAEELDRVMRDGLVPPLNISDGSWQRFRYAPMMTANTPVSLSLLDRLEPVAAELLGGPVLPTRAKGVLYSGDTPWHTDSDVPVESVGIAAYLEPLKANSGALRVLPGSHRPEFARALAPMAGATAEMLPGHIVETEPGDLILFDEHLFHASCGGGLRRQWRLDFLLDPAGAGAERHTRDYFGQLYPADWDGGYDVDRYPSYGPEWRRSGRESAQRLGELGVYTLADAQESYTRSRQ